MSLRRDNFSEAFLRLSETLSTYQSLWTESAFVEENLSWLPQYPELEQALLGLSGCELERLQDEESLLQFLLTLVAWPCSTLGNTLIEFTDIGWHPMPRF